MVRRAFAVLHKSQCAVVNVPCYSSYIGDTSREVFGISFGIQIYGNAKENACQRIGCYSIPHIDYYACVCAVCDFCFGLRFVSSWHWMCCAKQHCLSISAEYIDSLFIDCKKISNHYSYCYYTARSPSRWLLRLCQWCVCMSVYAVECVILVANSRTKSIM